MELFFYSLSCMMNGHTNSEPSEPVTLESLRRKLFTTSDELEKLKCNREIEGKNENPIYRSGKNM